MLTKVTINQFRSCEDLTLSNLGPSVVLIGQNGAGKSNILRSIQWAADVALRTNGAGRTDAPQSVTLEFQVNDTSYQYSVATRGGVRRDPDGVPRSAAEFYESISVYTRSGKWRELAVRRGDEIKLVDGVSHHDLGGDIPFLAFLFVFPLKDDVLRYLRAISQFLRTIVYYPFDEPNTSSEPHIIRRFDYQRWLDGSGNVRDAEASVLMKLLHMKFAMPDEFEEVRSILGPDGLALLNDICVDSSKLEGSTNEASDSSLLDFHLLNFSPFEGVRDSRRNTKFTFNDLSVGTRRIIRIVVAMIYDKSSVMLIEHPEDGIHRGLTRKLFGLLRSYSGQSQMILSSHSGLVLDELKDDTEAVRLVMMEDGVTKVHALTPEEEQQARRYIDEEGSFSNFIESRFDQ